VTVKELAVAPIPWQVAKVIFERKHYLHSQPGGTLFNFGVFSGGLKGAVCFARGATKAYRLVEGASTRDCATLARLWLSDELPRNRESRVIGVVLQALRRHSSLKFLISYADPAQGHLGTIYQATGWLCTGLSEAMPLYDLGDGIPRHSQSLSHAFGTHSVAHFQASGVTVRKVPQAAKHRYVYFLVGSWRPRLRVPVLPYPKKEACVETC